MKDIFLTKELINNLKLLPGQSTGCYGKCYEYDDMVLKVFKSEINKEMQNMIKKNLKRNSSIIMYPKSKMFLCDNKIKLRGYLCDKAPGNNLNILQTKIENNEDDILFDDFLRAYYEQFLPKLKKEDVFIHDVKFDHIFWKNGLYLIDTDLYRERFKFISRKEKDEANINIVNIDLTNFILKFISFENLKTVFKDLKIDDKCSELFISNLINDIRDLTNGNVNSFRQLFEYNYLDDSKDNSKSKIIK